MTKNRAYSRALLCSIIFAGASLHLQPYRTISDLYRSRIGFRPIRIGNRPLRTRNSFSPVYRAMAQFLNQDLEYMVDDYYDMTDFDDYPFEDTESRRGGVDESLDSDFEDDFELNKPKTDTSALEARNGKDIQGIPWDRLNYTRDKYRETRLKQYKNYENLSRSREELGKECKEVEKGHSFYDFQFNTRLVKSTIVHFQASVDYVIGLGLCQRYFVASEMMGGPELRILLNISGSNKN